MCACCACAIIVNHRADATHCSAAVLLLQAKQQEIEETQQQLADAQAALSDLQASFEPVSTTCTKQTCLCSTELVDATEACAQQLTAAAVSMVGSSVNIPARRVLCSSCFMKAVLRCAAALH